MGYGNGPSNPGGGYGLPPPSAPAPAPAPVRDTPIFQDLLSANHTRLQPVDERVEQARKVQQVNQSLARELLSILNSIYSYSPLSSSLRVAQHLLHRLLLVLPLPREATLV
jgi:hypothetical protein